jgi:hypothetical protein
MGRQQQPRLRAAVAQPAPPGRRSWNEDLSTSMVRTPPMSLAGAISLVLGRNEIMLRPGTPGTEENAIILDPVVATATAQSPNPSLDPGQVFANPISQSLIPQNYDPSQNPNINTQSALDSLGYLPQQRPIGWSERIAERAFENISPIGDMYYTEDRTNLALDGLKKFLFGDENRGHSEITSEDGWALFLGLPQKYGSFQVSPFRPSQSSDSTTYLRIPAIWDNIALTRNMLVTKPNGGIREASFPPSGRKITSGTVRGLLDAVGNDSYVIIDGDALGGDFEAAEGSEDQFRHPGMTLANFKLGRGVDELGRPYLSIYDRWDVGKIPGSDFIGTPFEVYDRLYYDPETLEPIFN